MNKFSPVGNNYSLANLCMVTTKDFSVYPIQLSNELCCVMMYHTNQPFLHNVLSSLLSLRDPLSHARKWGLRPNPFTLENHL